MSPDDRIATTILALLHTRAADATICPSEAARAIAPSRWRPLMPRVREVAATMAAAGEVQLKQRGRAISPFAEIRGPLRIALAPRDQPTQRTSLRSGVACSCSRSAR